MWGGEVQLPMGWACFYPFDHSEMTFGVQPSSPASRIQICPWPSALLGWDCPWGVVSDLAPCSELEQAHAGRDPHSRPTGTAAQGGDLAEGVESSFCFFPSFFFLQGLVGMSPVKTWAHIRLTSPSPFLLLADCHLLVSVPIMTHCSLPPSLWHCLGPISPWNSWKKGRFEQPKPAHCSPFPQLFSLPPCPDSEKRTGWISGQHPALPCSAPAGG